MRPTILVCEDEEALRFLLRVTLGERYRVVEARDGNEALGLASTVSPDLIVLDIVMPGRTGFDVLAALRSDPGFVSTPVIVLTARVQKDELDRMAALGADRCLAKPFSPAELVSAVEELLATGKAPE